MHFQVYHCPLIVDPFHAKGKVPVENGTYVDMLLNGGMNSKSFSAVSMQSGEVKTSELIVIKW